MWLKKYGGHQVSKEQSTNRWQRWEEEVKKFNKAREYPPPETTIKHWQHDLLFIFMQELSKHVLNDEETFDSIIKRVMEAFEIGCDFTRVRVYKVKGKDNPVLYLYKRSEGHGNIDRFLKLPIEKGVDDAVDTLFTGKPLVVDDVQQLKLKYSGELNPNGPYVAIPLFVQKKPYGLICADTVPPAGPGKNVKGVKYLEDKEHFHTFASSIIAAIENKNTIKQRNRKIKQFEMVKEFNELIEAEKDREKLLDSFVRHCVKVAHADGGHIKLYNKETKKLEQVAAYGFYVTPPEVKARPMDIGFYQQVFTKKEPLLVDDLSNHPLMLEHIKYGKEKGYKNYLDILQQRKSVIIVPLIKHTGEIYGILDLHSNKRAKFTEIDKENLFALASSVTYAVDKTLQLKKQNDLLEHQKGISETSGKLITMLQEAVGKAHDLKSVLKIIRDSCYKLKIVKNIKDVCLSIKDPLSNQLNPPFDQCSKPNKECRKCLKNEPVIQAALESQKTQKRKNKLALPIVLQDEVIGVLYFQGNKEISLEEDEEKLLEIITNTAAILISTARNYEEKIKHSATLYEVGQLSTMTRDFREWFNPVMKKVLDIIGSRNRNFHLVMVEEVDNKEILVVRATTPLFIDGNHIPLKDILLDLELPIDESLAGEVIKEKKTIILDVGKNKELPKEAPGRRPYHEYDPRIKSEVGIPLKIKEGDQEKVIGVLIFDSIKHDDFKDFDSKFHETIANYLTTIIHNQQLYAERSKRQEELYSLDRSLALQAFMKSFFHDITAPVQEIRSQINIMKEDGEADYETNLEKLEELADKLLYSYGEFVNDFTRPFSEPKLISLKDIVSNSLDSVEKTRGLEMISIKGNFENSDVTIECYSVFIEMTFRAIINNAVKYSRRLDPEKKYLKIDVDGKENDRVTISFESSTTEEIPPQDLTRIFQLFVRSSNKEKGQGLGLGVAAECVHLHNGEITAENVKGKSAVRFRINLPKTLKIKEEKKHE
jgi:GAF domain-containing protein